MFSVNDTTQDLWVGDDTQGGSLVSSTSGYSRSEFENFAAENGGGKQAPGFSSIPNGKAPIKTPGVLRAGDTLLMRNGQSTLPPEKAFSIQIGWKLFRLSGASIMSDGKLVCVTLQESIAELPRAPSYFSTYFEEQLRLEEQGSGPMKTLFIDRDPDTFADICRHLQGRRAARASQLSKG